jgi:hypothetical protein
VSRAAATRDGCCTTSTGIESTSPLGARATIHVTPLPREVTRPVESTVATDEASDAY